MPKLDLYSIVIGKNASYNEISTAKFLANNISTATGYKINVYTDDVPAKQHEIVVGKTSREESEGVVFERTPEREYEYEIRFVGTKLFMSGLGIPGEKIVTPYQTYARLDDGAIGTSLASCRFVETLFGEGFLFPAEISSFVDLDASEIEIDESLNYVYTRESIYAQRPKLFDKAAFYSVPVMGSHRRFGDCLIFKSEDGSFTVYNGGFEHDAEQLCTLLEYLNENKSEKPKINTWMISMPVFGYSGALKAICENEALCARLSVNKVCYSVLSEKFYTSGSSSCKAEYAAFRTALLNANEALGCEMCEVKTGDVIGSGDYKIEVLWAPTEEIESKPKVHLNDSSIVYKVYYGEQSIVLFGNARKQASDALCATPEKLACDVVQMANHGRDGVSRACYAATGAKKYLYQSNPAIYYGDNGEGFASEGGSISRTRNYICENGVKREDICKDTYGIISVALPAKLK